MQLTVRDVAKGLRVTEKTVYRWIEEKNLPAYQVNNQYRFNAAELLEWATARKLKVSPDVMAGPEGASVPFPKLSAALEAGGIHYRIGGADKDSVLRSVVRVLNLPDDVDRDSFFQVLMARESMGSTGIGDGIAIPHVRTPIVLFVNRPSITLCFLEKPIEFDALDGRPVHILFTLISQNVRTHLHLLSVLSFALRDSSFKQAVTQQASKEEILAEAHRAETAIAASRLATPAMEED